MQVGIVIAGKYDFLPHPYWDRRNLTPYYNDNKEI